MSTATTIEWVEDAVRHHPLHTPAGFWQGVFARWFSSFVYNQIWEDPRVDVEALQLGSDSRVLTISSGGCNVLHYLLADPASVTAIDLNGTHLALLRLKLAALRHLPGHAEFYTMFGEARSKQNRWNYDRWLRAALDDETREFWEGGNLLRQTFLGPRLEYLRKGLYDHAHLGWFLRAIHFAARALGHDVGRIVHARTREEARQIFEEEIAPLLDGRLVRFVSRLPFALFSLGVPPQQQAAMHAEEGSDLAAVLRGRVERLACAFPMTDNYFAWQAFTRGYDNSSRQAVPDYLREENFHFLRERADRVQTQQCGLRGFLSRQKPESFDSFVLLDAQDWMPDHEISGLWAEIARVGTPGARIAFRTAASVSPLERAVPPTLFARFHEHADEARRLHAQDRSAIYGAFHLYELRA